MKKINSLLLMVSIIISNVFSAQTSTETFETESNGSSSFTDNGVIFNIISHVGKFDVQGSFPGTGWNGTANDNRYIDNSNDSSNPPSFSIKTTSNLFKVNRFWMYLSALNLDLNVAGTLTVTGKLSGVTKFTQTKTNGFATSLGVTNGYTLIDMTNLNGQNYSNIIIDELRITMGGNFRYAGLDAFKWVKDSNIVIDPNALYVSVGSQGNVSCNGGSDGFATVNVSGGQTPYTYSWSPSGGTAATATGLVAGNYTVTVTDAANVSKTLSFTITEANPINVSVSGNTTCANTVATVSAIGADEFLWYNQQADVSPYFTGQIFTTPVLPASTTYYTQGVSLSPQKVLQTTFAGVNNHRGNMFNVTAQKDLVINSFDVSPMGNTTVEVYYKEGTYIGYENNPAAWKKLGSANVVYTGSPVNITVGKLTIPAGKTYALYVTSNQTSVALNYSNGSVGEVFSDSNMTITTGAGLEYPFTGLPPKLYSPRTWNGRINYKLIDCSGSRQAVQVTVNSTPAPTGSTTQTFNQGDQLSVLNVTGVGIKWYASASDAENHINALPATTTIVHDEIYYATQTVDGCESVSSLAVHVLDQTLAAGDVDKTTILTIYPNPVHDILKISSGTKINKVVITDYSGRNVLECITKGNIRENIDVRQLSQGNYIIQIFTDQEVKALKFIKN